MSNSDPRRPMSNSDARRPMSAASLPCASRREWFSTAADGLSAVAFAWLLQRDSTRASGLTTTSALQPHYAPRAKRVVQVFCAGGVSHLETFDPKPLLNKFAGKTYDETNLPNPTKSPLFLLR